MGCIHTWACIFICVYVCVHICAFRDSNVYLEAGCTFVCVCANMCEQRYSPPQIKSDPPPEVKDENDFPVDSC